MQLMTKLEQNILNGLQQLTKEQHQAIEHAQYLRQTLAHDLHDIGMHQTAYDVVKAASYIEQLTAK